METNKIPVAVLHETKLLDKATCKAPPGYSMLTKNRNPEKGKAEV